MDQVFVTLNGTFTDLVQIGVVSAKGASNFSIY